MSKIKYYLKFVEIQTKVASVLPFLAGTLLALYLKVPFKGINALLMLFSLLCIDMTTTGLNHYVDFKKAVLKEGYHYEVHNPLGQGAIKKSHALTFLMALISIGVALGVVLVYKTDYWVLFLGALAFGIGLLYSAGPLPISRTILGEAFSGGFMGILIPFLAFYIHAFEQKPLDLSLNEGNMTFLLNGHLILPILWMGIPLALLIANIMLANNICDMEEDKVNLRHTLPIAIGKTRSLTLYKSLVVLAFVVLALGIVLRILPIGTAVVFLGTPVFIKQTKGFLNDQKKGITFVNAVKNFIGFGALLNIGLLISIVFI